MAPSIALDAVIAYNIRNAITWEALVANLTIRGLDEAIKTNLRLQAARQGHSMEEAARQILRRALMTSDTDVGGLGSCVHEYFVGAGAIDLTVPERSTPRAALDFSESDG